MISKIEYKIAYVIGYLVGFMSDFPKLLRLQLLIFKNDLILLWLKAQNGIIRLQRARLNRQIKRNEKKLSRRSKTN